MAAVAAHVLIQPLDSADAVAFGDHNRQWIILADRLDPAQCDLLVPHIEIALGDPEAGVRGLLVPYGAAAAMAAAPWVETGLLALDGPGDLSALDALN